MTDFSRLENIYRMMQPADLMGAQKLSLGKPASIDMVQQLLDVLYNVGAGGALTLDKQIAKLNELTSKVADDETKRQFRRILRVYNSLDLRVDGLSQSQYMYKDRDGKTVKDDIKFNQIVGFDVNSTGKKMSILLSNSAFLSPMMRNAERVELFMNNIPSIVASRMVPYLEVEMVFDRPRAAPLQTVSQLKFLLGADASAAKDSSSPTGKMLNASRIANDRNEISVAGMEMFTSPQTLVNPTPVAEGSRYVDVIDPFRPFATIESFTVNIASTVGLFSYKKGNLVFKLHDRSRLAEISDLVQPQVYTNTTIWITYGWRHPYEPGNPYADFINNNMMTREAYGIVNSNFAFDQLGQVNVTLELFTKGITEMRTIRISDDDNEGRLDAIKQLASIAKRIAEYKRQLNIGPIDGLNREIRAVQIIEAAESGTFPDLSTKEIKDAIKAIESSLKSKDSKLDQEAVNGLLRELNKFYAADAKGNFDFNAKVQTQATTKVRQKFMELLMGADPFLPFDEKFKDVNDTGLEATHPYAKLVTNFNSATGTLDEFKDFKNKLVSFGKLFAVFAGRLINAIPGVDELQTVFYQFNDQAGDAAGTNIAEFPIDMPVFLDQYRDHVVRTGSERMTLEAFLQLVRDAQIDDVRAVAYGYRDWFEPYDPKAKLDAKLKKGKEGVFEAAIAGLSKEKGPFKKPVIDFYVETTYVAEQGAGSNDLLGQLETQTALQGSPNAARVDQLTRVMRIHIFDKQSNPFKLPGLILRGDTEHGPAYVEVPSDFRRNTLPDQKRMLESLQGLINGVVDLKQNGGVSIALGPEQSGRNGTRAFSNQRVKEIVSKMLPTIVYGSNATAVGSANLASKQNPLLSTIQMMNSKMGRANATQPNGSGIGGMPLRIVPASMSMSTMGCPLLVFGQQFFIDFNTGTTVDNIYNLTGIQHVITPGKFESQLTLTFYDAYGRYEGAPNLIEFIKQMQV